MIWKRFYILFTCIFLPSFGLILSGEVLAAANPTKPAPWVGQAFDGRYCTGHAPNFGPYDYLMRNQLTAELSVVEKWHFNADVENLVKGMTTTSALGDINYVLGAWPNHHRALYSVIRYRINTWDRTNTGKKRTPAECYLQRAINFSPEDPNIYMLYGILLHKTDHKNEAIENYQKALALSPADVQIKYNLALLYLDLGRYKEAKALSEEVYSAGYPLKGLQNRLKSAGY